MPWNRPLIIGLLVVLLAISWWRLLPDDQEIRRSQLLMGTVVEIVAEGESSDKLEAAVDAAFAEMIRLDQLLSRHHQKSDVSRLSRIDTGTEVAVETAEIIADFLFRGIDEAGIRTLLERIRTRIPDITLRTSLIVGFPGETDEQFRKVLAFVEEGHFE